MSKLLIDGKARITEGKLATALGINESIILHQIHFWITENEKHQRISYQKEGFWWCWNTMAKWQEEFPWLNAKKIERCLATLKRHGVLIGQCLHENKLNRTLWYRIDYKRLEAFIGAFDTGVACNLQKQQDDLYTKKTFRSSKLQPARSTSGGTEQPEQQSKLSAAQSYPTHPEGYIAVSRTRVTYPDKSLTTPVLNPDKSNEYIQPTYSPFLEFEFDTTPAPEEGSTPLWNEDGCEFLPYSAVLQQDDRATAQPDNDDNQPHLESQDRIQKEKKVPPPRKMSRDAQNRAYRYDKAGWLQLPPSSGQNSQARAIAVRAMQELIVHDHGHDIEVLWEQDDDGLWYVNDSKNLQELSIREAFDKDGQLTLRELRNFAVTYAGMDCDTFNEDLQRLYEAALEHCLEHGPVKRLREGERWIDQPLFEEYLGEWVQCA